MTVFWSWYICFLTLGSLFALLWLVFSTRSGETPNGGNTTMGHSFDGIEEYDNPLPRWWFLLFVGTIFFAFIYLLLYPGLGNWKGVLPGYSDGWTQVNQWQREVDKADAQYGPLFARMAATPLEALSKDPEALKIGGRLFANNCAMCHGSDAKGTVGFPNLTDSIWRWGGDAETVKTTILHGRQAAMPAWGPVIGDAGVKNVAAFVRTKLAGLPLPVESDADVAAGATTYASTCQACHGPEGKGTPLMGAPDLTHPGGWIYGSSLTQLQQTIRHGRNGQMPAQEQYLGNDKVHVLAAYVLSLSRQE